VGVIWKVRRDGVKQRFNLSPLRKEVAKLYNNGLSSRKVGNSLGISHARVLKLLKSEKVVRRDIIKSIPNLNYQKLTPSRAYIFGVMCGDGCVFSGIEKKDRWNFKSHIVHLSVKDKDFLEEYMRNFKEVYGFLPRIYYRRGQREKWSNIWIARVNRKNIYEDLDRYKFGKMWLVPEEIMKSQDKRIVCSFLRGIYDSEGSVTVGLRGASISFTNVSKRGIEQVKELLDRVGISSSKIGEHKFDKSFRKNRCYYFTITHLENYLLFLENIGFSIKRKETKLIKYVNSLKKNKTAQFNLKTRYS
jgi:intein-encoded DNA endonuclease-like protein